MSCSSSVKTVDVKQDNSPRRNQHREEAKAVQVKFWTFKKTKRTFIVMERQLQRIFQQGFQYAVSRRQESWVYRQRSGHFLHMSWRATGEQSSQRQGWLFPDATELASRPVEILADGERKKTDARALREETGLRAAAGRRAAGCLSSRLAGK